MKIQDGHELTTAFELDLPLLPSDRHRGGEVGPKPSHRWIAQALLLVVVLLIGVFLGRLAK